MTEQLDWDILSEPTSPGRSGAFNNTVPLVLKSSPRKVSLPHDQVILDLSKLGNAKGVRGATTRTLLATTLSFDRTLSYAAAFVSLGIGRKLTSTGIDCSPARRSPDIYVELTDANTRCLSSTETNLPDLSTHHLNRTRVIRDARKIAFEGSRITSQVPKQATFCCSRPPFTDPNTSVRTGLG